MSRARYILVGGFLGAGKTTALAALARHFQQHGKRVGLITNDQGSELVDTATFQAGGFATEEIPGGCFCCRFNSLITAVQRLEKKAEPEFFLAEPVGSCTDLVATVTYPLQKLYGDAYEIAPVSALVDPIRAEQLLGLAPGDCFHDKVLYIYRKQLEEADVIVITKTDLVDVARLERLRAKLAETYPHAKIFAVSVKEKRGLDEWFAELATGRQGTRPAMDVDYEIYAEGEAMLGWLNATIEFTLRQPANGEVLLASVGRHLRTALAGIEIAHLKIALRPDDSTEVGIINLIGRNGKPEISRRMDQSLDVGELTINLRAETHPEKLHTAVRAAAVGVAREFPGMLIEFAHLHYFKPGKPEPTHRMTTAA